MKAAKYFFVMLSIALIALFSRINTQALQTGTQRILSSDVNKVYAAWDVSDRTISEENGNIMFQEVELYNSKRSDYYALSEDLQRKIEKSHRGNRFEVHYRDTRPRPSSSAFPFPKNMKAYVFLAVLSAVVLSSFL